MTTSKVGSWARTWAGRGDYFAAAHVIGCLPGPRGPMHRKGQPRRSYLPPCMRHDYPSQGSQRLDRFIISQLRHSDGFNSGCFLPHGWQSSAGGFAAVSFFTKSWRSWCFARRYPAFLLLYLSPDTGMSCNDHPSVISCLQNHETLAGRRSGRRLPLCLHDPVGKGS
jgi:hypothetical protein